MRKLAKFFQNLPKMQCFPIEQKVSSSFWKALSFFSCQNSKFLEISFGR